MDAKLSLSVLFVGTLVALVMLVRVGQVESSKSKELKTDFLVFLNNMKLRNPPLAKQLGERRLSQLYRQEREMSAEIDDIERGMDMVHAAILPRLTQTKLDEWELDLEDKKRELSEVQARIQEAKKIIKDPINFISVPTDYAKDVAGQREREQDQLARDRAVAQYRQEVLEGTSKPSWLVDEW